MLGGRRERARRRGASPYVAWERRKLIDEAIRELTATHRPAGTVVEIGCGSGWLLAGLSARGVEPQRLVGVEKEPARAKAAEKNCPGTSILSASATEVPLESGSAAAVIMASVLSTVDAEERHALLAEAHRLLAPGGVLLVYEHRRGWMTRDPYPTPYSVLCREIGDAVSVRTLGLLPPLRFLRGATLLGALSGLRLTRSHYLALFEPARVAANSTASRAQVTMLVRNSGIYDTRVRKEAISLTRLGYRVTVLALAEEGMERFETLEGVDYVRIAVPRTRLERIRGDFVIAQASARDAYLERSARHRRRRRRASDSYRRGARRRSERLSKRIGRLRDSEKPAERLEARTLRLRSRDERRTRLARALFDRRAEWIKRWSEWSRNRYLRGTERRKRRRARRIARYRAWVPLHLHLEYHRAVGPVLAQLDPEVVHAHDLNTLYAAFHYTLRHRRKLVYDSHELELHRNKEWTVRDRIFSRVVETMGIIKASRTITVGPEIAADLRRTYRIRLPAVVLNSPPLATVDRVVERDIRSLAGVSPSTVLMAYVGGIGMNRGVEYVLEALALLPSRFHLAIVGPRRDDYDNPLRERAAQLNVRGRFHLLRPVPAADVPATLRGASLCVIPIQNVCRSYDLCMPNKLFDAVMAELPIAAASLQSLIAFVERHGLGDVFDQTDPRSIADVVTRIGANPPPAVRSPAALRELQRSVAWERQEEVLAELYREILEPVTGDPGAVAAEQAA